MMASIWAEFTTREESVWVEDDKENEIASSDHARVNVKHDCENIIITSQIEGYGEITILVKLSDEVIRSFQAFLECVKVEYMNNDVSGV